MIVQQIPAARLGAMHVCSHWCHAACALESNLIKPGPTLKGAMGTTEMQFQCLGCNHASEMIGFVKEVFNCCAENWIPETQMKELDFNLLGRYLQPVRILRGRGSMPRQKRSSACSQRNLLPLLKPQAACYNSLNVRY